MKSVDLLFNIHFKEIDENIWQYQLKPVSLSHQKHKEMSNILNRMCKSIIYSHHLKITIANYEII